MNHKEILAQYTWKSYDNDWAYWNQCVDWIKWYSKLRGREITTRGNAFDLWNKWLWPKWKKIPKTALNYPSEWDVVIWGTSWGGWYWHIAIANSMCNPAVLRTTDQNAGTGNWDWKGKNAISPFFRSYKWVVGWFTYIG